MFTTVQEEISQWERDPSISTGTHFCLLDQLEDVCNFTVYLRWLSSRSELPDLLRCDSWSDSEESEWDTETETECVVRTNSKTVGGNKEEERLRIRSGQWTDHQEVVWQVTVHDEEAPASQRLKWTLSEEGPWVKHRKWKITTKCHLTFVILFVHEKQNNNQWSYYTFRKSCLVNFLKPSLWGHCEWSSSGQLQRAVWRVRLQTVLVFRLGLGLGSEGLG